MDAKPSETGQGGPSKADEALPKGGKSPGKGDKEPKKRRPRRQVKAIARSLTREAKRILRKYPKRLSPEAAEGIKDAAAAMNAAVEAENWAEAEDQAEHLDEVLHVHASFARMSPLRETIGNVAIAVIVALGLRSCVYEPFKIPSGSMYPTLRIGDHIFVNKFVYGIQMPMTSTVVLQDMVSEIQRGDVIVFRFPLDTSQDYIKRVVGVPGDTLRFDGRDIWIKGADDNDFWKVERRRTEEKCLQDDGVTILERCEVFEEKLGAHTYNVRYLTDVDIYAEGTRSRTIEVPEGGYLVLGDNRDQSRDSLQWTAPVEAVSAEHLVTQKDLRDLTVRGMFTLKHPREVADNQDPSRDAVMYLGEHRDEKSDITLQAWRNPIFGADAVRRHEVSTLRGKGGKASTIAQLLEDGHSLDRDEIRVGKLGEEIVDELYTAKVEAGPGEPGTTRWIALFNDKGTDSWFRLECGAQVCKSSSELARYVVDTLQAYADDHDETVRNLITGPRTARYTPQWTSREQPQDRYQELLFAHDSSAEARDQVRLRAFRDMREAPEDRGGKARAAAGLFQLDEGVESPVVARTELELTADAEILELDDRFVGIVNEGPGRPVLFVLECGKRQCKGLEDAAALVTTVHERVPQLTDTPSKMAGLLKPEDVSGLNEVMVDPLTRYDWDRVRLQATLRGGDHTFSVEVEREPEAGLEARFKELRGKLDRPEDVNLGDMAAVSSETGGFRLVFAVARTDALVSLYCGPGLCPDQATIQALGERAVAKAQDESNFVDPTAERARPFVPRGNIKGRADRIWWPSARFGMVVD